jgi:hypothetical protein
VKVVKHDELKYLISHEHLEGVDSGSFHGANFRHFASDILVPVAYDHVKTAKEIRLS